MKLTRRHLAAAGVLALGASPLFRATSSHAAAADEAALTQAIEALRKATLSQDKAALEKLAAAELSYGHSSAVVQNKVEFIDGVMTRKAVVKSIEFPELKISMAGNNAIARHLWVSESEMDGKATSTKIGILGVWTKQDDGWKLLARQGFKLA
jgi:ketosteroid isomerase-like protein